MTTPLARLSLARLSLARLFLAGFILSSPLAAQVAGVVNGDTIWLDTYSREVGRRAQLNMQTQTLSASAVLQTTWLDMVDDLLLWQESQRRMIDVSPREIDSVLLLATPDFVKRGVVNDQGRFDPALLRAMMLQPDSLVRARGKNFTPEEIERQTSQLSTSMADLRSRVGSMIRMQRLRSSVESLIPIDSAALRKNFHDAATTVTADVIYLPCPPYGAEPTPQQIEAWYKKYPERYTTTEEMRRMAFLTWEMRASPIDSSLILSNVRSFVSLLNSTKKSVTRDSIWNSVASTVSSGAARLHPDSASHQMFYEVLKGARVGTAFGPIMHPSGVHVLLVDSVLNAPSRKGSKKTKTPGTIYVVRVAISDVDPSRETVDSTLGEVNTAVEMYERGKTFGELSQSFDRKIEFTPFFKHGDEVYGSYRLADVAFMTQIAAMADPVDAPDKGVLIGVVTDSIAPGPLPIEAVEERIMQELRNELACTSIEQDVKGLSAVVTRLDDGMMVVGAPIKNSTILRDASIDPQGFMGEEIFDPLAARAVCNASSVGLMGPFRGDAGWYMVNIRNINRASDDEFPLYLELRGADLIAEQRAKQWETWKASVRKSAKIEDLRWQYFRY